MKLGSSISGFEDVGGIGGVTFTLLLAIAASLAFAWPETRNLLSLERSMGALPSRLSGTAEEATAPVPLAQSPLLFQLNQQLRALAGGSALQETRERWVRRLGEAAASEERNRLARELHDSIKQQLFSIKMSAAATAARWNTDPPGAQSSLEDVRRCAHEAMVEMQALLLQLRPEALANVGLVEALKEQGEALQYRSGATVHCDIGELPPESQLPPAIQ
ncbi:MAG: histidine kinase [Acidobacteriota bacterium]